MNIAIIGSGLSGLSLAQTLQAAGQTVTLFDKGRGPGGRLSTRRVTSPLGELSFDHGTSTLVAQSAALQAVIANWAQAGWIAPWPGPHLRAQAFGAEAVLKDQIIYTGAPKMNALIRALSESLNVQWQTEIDALLPSPQGWQLRCRSGGILTGFDVVALAVPMEQARTLCASDGLMGGQIWPAQPSSACWSVMLAYEGRVEADWSTQSFATGPIAWISRENSKPGRTGPPRFVVHTSSDWSAEHLECSPEAILARLDATLQAHLPFGPPRFAAAHRWRFARPTQHLSQGAVWTPHIQFGVCGDWLLPGPGVEAAWHSGKRLAEEILSKA